MSPIGPRLESLLAVYRAAAGRMRDLPVFNPALQVEAVGFQPFNRGWIGILIAPWFMNLVYLPDAPDAELGKDPTARVPIALPAGGFDFYPSEDARLGRYLICSLFSPMWDFADQAGARLTAEAALGAIFTPSGERAPDPVPVEAPAAAQSLGRRELFGLRD